MDTNAQVDEVVAECHTVATLLGYTAEVVWLIINQKPPSL